MLELTILEGIEAIIFDLDGTLVNSMGIWAAVDEEYYEKYNLTPPEGFHEAMEGLSYTEVAQLYLDTFPTLTCTIEGLKQEWQDMTYEKYTKELDLKPGAYKMIETLYNAGIKFGISSSNSIELVIATLEALNIRHFFDVVHTSCEVKSGKPCPDVYLLTAADLNVLPEKCLVFEDVPKGIMAGKNAGMKVCAIDDEYSKNQEDKKRELADYYINDYNDILNSTYEVL